MFSFLNPAETPKKVNLLDEPLKTQQLIKILRSQVLYSRLERPSSQKTLHPSFHGPCIPTILKNAELYSSLFLFPVRNITIKIMIRISRRMKPVSGDICVQYWRQTTQMTAKKRRKEALRGVLWSQNSGGIAWARGGWGLPKKRGKTKRG